MKGKSYDRAMVEWKAKAVQALFAGMKQKVGSEMEVYYDWHTRSFRASLFEDSKVVARAEAPAGDQALVALAVKVAKLKGSRV